MTQFWTNCQKPWFLYNLPIFWSNFWNIGPFLANNITINEEEHNSNYLKSFQAISSRKNWTKTIYLKKLKNFWKFFWGKTLGHYKGESDWKIFFLHFYAQNDLILKIEQKKIFRKKKIFGKKNFRAPQKWPFSAISRPKNLILTCGFLQKFRNDLFFRFKPFPDKTNAKFFFKVPKTSKNLIFGHFWPKKWPN